MQLDDAVEYLLPDPPPKKYVVAWRCQKCCQTTVGFLAVGDTYAPACGSNYYPGRLKYPQRIKTKDGSIVPYVCKGTMVLLIDRRPS